MSKETIDRLTSLLNSSKELHTPYLAKIEEEVQSHFGKENPDLNELKDIHKMDGKSEIQNVSSRFEHVLEQLNELCFLSELTLSEIDLNQDAIKDLDKVLNNLVKIASISENMLNDGTLSGNLMKDTYIQVSNISEFIEEIAGQMKEDGSSNGNNDLKYIVRKLEDIRDYPSREMANLKNKKESYLDLLENISKILD